MQEQEIKITYGHYFELLDRTHVASVNLQNNVGEHPVLHLHPELKASYDKAAEALAELYQNIGVAMEGFKG